jgi:hypothetical protein
MRAKDRPRPKIERQERIDYLTADICKKTHKPQNQNGMHPVIFLSLLNSSIGADTETEPHGLSRVGVSGAKPG